MQAVFVWGSAPAARRPISASQAGFGVDRIDSACVHSAHTRSLSSQRSRWVSATPVPRRPDRLPADRSEYESRRDASARCAILRRCSREDDFVVCWGNQYANGM